MLTRLTGVIHEGQRTAEYQNDGARRIQTAFIADPYIAKSCSEAGAGTFC